MDLCLALGCTLEELGERMSVAEFEQWLAGWMLGLWGRNRADVRAATIAATVANYAGRMRSEEKGPAAPTDFIPPDPFAVEPDEPEPDPGEFFGKLM